MLLTLPRDWSGRLLRADVRMDGLLRDLRTQVSQPRAEQEVVVLDARGRRLDQGGGSGSVPPWSLPVGSAQRAETPQGLVLWRSFDPLGRARGSRERWIVALRIPPRRLQQLGLLHQPAGLALVLTLYAGTAVTATLLALGRRQRQRQQAQFAQVLDSLLDPHMLLRPVHDGRGRILDFRIAHCNQAADRYNEAESAPVTRRTLLEWLPDHQTSGLLDAYANAMASGAVVVFDDFPCGIRCTGSGGTTSAPCGCTTCSA